MIRPEFKLEGEKLRRVSCVRELLIHSRARRKLFRSMLLRVINLSEAFYIRREGKPLVESVAITQNINSSIPLFKYWWPRQPHRRLFGRKKSCRMSFQSPRRRRVIDFYSLLLSRERETKLMLRRKVAVSLQNVIAQKFSLLRLLQLSG